MVQGQVAGVAAVLPEPTEVSALPRGCRLGAARGRHRRAVHRAAPPQVSRLQAEISWIDGKLNFVSLGKTFNHVNRVPLHADVKRVLSRVQIYNGDVIRLGARPMAAGGGFSDFVFLVDAPALGNRPHASGTGAPLSVPVAMQPASAPPLNPPPLAPRAAAAPPHAMANEAEAERAAARVGSRAAGEAGAGGAGP